MTGIDRDALARIIHQQVHWEDAEPDPCPEDFDAADAVIAHLGATDRPTDTGLREQLRALIGKAGREPIHGVPAVHADDLLDLLDSLAAPDPGPDQGDGYAVTLDLATDEVTARRAVTAYCPGHRYTDISYHTDVRDCPNVTAPAPDAADPEGSQR